MCLSAKTLAAQVGNENSERFAESISPKSDIRNQKSEMKTGRGKTTKTANRYKAPKINGTLFFIAVEHSFMKLVFSHLLSVCNITIGIQCSSGPVRAVSDACFVVSHAVTIMTNMNTQSSNNRADEGKNESGGRVKTTFSISKMDCPSEERMIRMKLGGLTNIRSLQFDTPNRKLEVYHTDSCDNLLAALNSLQLDAKLVFSEPTDMVNIKCTHRQEKRVLWQVLAINFFFFALEMLTGFFAGSMGLVADSLDMLADSIVYALSLFAVDETISRKKNVAGTAGYFQLVLAVLGFVEVIRRFVGHGEIPDFRLMIIISLLALSGNAICLYLLRKSKSQEAHMQASMIFTSTDVIVNLGVIIAGIIVYLTTSKLPDLIVGTIIFVLVGRGAYRILQLSK